MKMKQGGEDSPDRALAIALASYTIWLCDSLAAGTPANSSGAELLVHVRAVQQPHFPDAGALMAEVLRRHTQIATMMYEHKLTAVRAGAAERLASSEAVGLAQAQFVALQALRTYCSAAHA
jgi:hypothetical protein